MLETDSTIVPLGSLAIIFAVTSVLVFIRKASISRESDEFISERMDQRKKIKSNSLEEQKKRLELLLKK
tara:strand:+ start:579 stop:785 length:207 start_codon:yes stop_codon:yes gene_type:complete